MTIELTARQHLEKRGAFFYLISYGLLFVSSFTLQIVTGLPFKQTIPGVIVSAINMILATLVYIKKKNGKKANILPWFIGGVSVHAPIMVKYTYVLGDGWTFAAQSTSATLSVIGFAIMLYLFYQPNLYMFFAIYTLAHWILFLYLAVTHGAEMHFVTHINGVPITSGVIFNREVFMIIVAAIIFLVGYRNIPDITKYEERVEIQSDQIKKHADAQETMTAIIKEKMNILFKKVDTQHELISRFNLRMETQASSFTEMSATMEELAGSAEQIASESITQIDGNVKMEAIVDEFKNIQVETKQNLAETYADIQSVSDKSNVANEQLMEVEKTVFAIKEQSGRIGDTVNLIVDIADRINLLSLNAAIEAARAGESGRGFAVVADEIGKLAFQTQESIKEINAVLSNSSRNTVEGVAVIQKTAVMMREMIAHMGQSSHKIQLLQESIFIEEKYIKIIIEQMTDNISLAKKIGTATDEQKIAVDSTSRALEDLIVILNEMVEEIKDLTGNAHDIHENAIDVMIDTERVVNG